VPSTSPEFTRIEPQVVEHRDGWRVQVADRYDVELVVGGTVIRLPADLDGPTVRLHRDSYAIVVAPRVVAVEQRDSAVGCAASAHRGALGEPDAVARRVTEAGVDAVGLHVGLLGEFNAGAPGMAMSTMAIWSWSRGPTDSQRKLPISGTVTSSRTSKPTLSVQKVSASSWSCTQSWAVLIRITVSSGGLVLRRVEPTGAHHPASSPIVLFTGRP
jgi:hypothetical protein